MTDIFFYGSLRDRELVEIVLGHAVADDALVPAMAEGWATRNLAHEAYPVLVPAKGRRTEGLLLVGPSAVDVARLAFFEEAEYGLAPISVEANGQRHEAVYFRGTEKPPLGEGYWSYAVWRANERAVAVAAADEYMAYYGRMPVEEIDTIWPGIMIRARQRARARAETPPAGDLRQGRGVGDVTLESRERAYASYLSVEEFSLTHRRFDGTQSAPLSRSVVLWGDAVTVLPYDPVRDRVHLIEQFRAPLFARGDPHPWCIEVIAGRIDTDESAAEVARREAEEEGGLSLGRLIEIGRYYSSPGLAAEQIVGFVAEADLSGEGTLHGREDEQEDIRSLVLDFDVAMAAAVRGAVNAGPALVSLLWLARERERLRAEWRAS